MKPSLDKLHKFLKLEANRGYDNRAVLGGLDRILTPWEAEARSEGVPEDLIQVVMARLRDYRHLSPGSRYEALDGVWSRIQHETDSPLPRLNPPPSPVEASDLSSAEPGSLTQTENRLTAEVGSALIHPESGKPGVENGESPSRDLRKAAQRPNGLQARPREIHKTFQSTPQGPTAALDAPVTVLSGVGPRHAQTLSRLDIHSLGDMLYYFPRRYDDYTQLKPINRLFFGQEVTVIATVQSINARPIRGGRQQMVEVIVNDGSGALRVNWFNQPWIGRRLREGMHVVLSGKVEQYLGRLVMNNPEVEQLEQQSLHTNRIVPVYSLTANITQHWLRRMMFQVVSYWAPRVQDYLPEGVRRSADLIDLPNALLQVHFPDSQERLHAARERLAFDEIFLLQLGVLRQKRTWQSRTARVFETTSDWLDEQVGCLPFTLTSAQQHALADVRADLASGHPMNRLLQGDVGSGKTVIAALAIAMLARHGAQSAILAPTSILAEQHYLNLQKLLTEKSKPDSATQPALQPNEIVLLTGATPEPEKNDTRERLASGEIKLVVGTHALIEDPITFSDLQLAIIDEQHRFGVEQRAALRRKGDNPHLLVMTATPIPRSLALTVYGDLDLSLMDEMPPGRQLVETHVLLPRERERAYSLIHNQVEKNYQAFIIYPLIEEGETEEAQPAGHGAVEEHARLQSQVFPNHVLGLLHGRLKADEKEAVMAGFRDREIDVLVSTSVVEVGVDIVNATVMLVEGANRFGLAQLHQFRGRVGRGEAQAYCLLIPETADHAENERLSAMVETNDGFILAERDLEQRGPGEFLGTRQSGYHSELRMASLTDIRLIEKARRQAQAIFEADPDLEGAEHQSLAAAVEAYWGIKEQMTQGDIS